jgi:hypothetical protein
LARILQIFTSWHALVKFLQVGGARILHMSTGWHALVKFLQVGANSSQFYKLARTRQIFTSWREFFKFLQVGMHSSNFYKLARILLNLKVRPHLLDEKWNQITRFTHTTSSTSMEPNNNNKKAQTWAQSGSGGPDELLKTSPKM